MAKGRLNVPGPSGSAPLADRFWSRVRKGETCWEWLGSRWQNNYGRIIDGGKQLKAHRVSWELNVGPTNGLWVLHACDNPPCVRPDHLFLGDAPANVHDMVMKGRHSHGEGAATAKLTVPQVIAARHAHSRGVRIATLARRYGITDVCMGYLIHRKNWKSVP